MDEKLWIEQGAAEDLEMPFPWLSVDEFEEKIKQDAFVSVTFTSPRCKPCQQLCHSFLTVKDRFPVTFYLFNKYQADERVIPILHNWLVGFPPRTIIFKDGKDVGRFFWIKSPEEMEALLSELMNTGEILPETSDTEMVCLYRDRVVSALRWNWDASTITREDKAEEFIALADKLMSERKDWGLLSVEEIRILLKPMVGYY